MKEFLRHSILCLLVLASLSGYSQTFPVQSSLQLTPPYSIKLPDYVAPGSERIVLNAMLNDISRAQLDVELRVTIEGQGIRIVTNPNINPDPITLTSGINSRLSGSDLEPYFRAENLQFFGLGRQQFINSGGALPEGIYRFCIDVVEANRDVRIAQTSCATAWLILNDPPIINIPRANTKLEPSNPQFVRFQWTPRHTGSPNSAFNTEYDFELVEVWPGGRNINDAILTTTSIYETTTMATSLVYGPTEPALVRGRQYAFRVRARSVSGVEQLDLFRNEGYSEVQSFIYGDECIVPSNISMESTSSRTIEVFWDADPVHSGFLVRYRQVGESDWIEERILFNDYKIEGLIPDTNYEVQILGICGFSTSEESKIIRTKTQAPIAGDFSCGSPPVEFNLDNRNPLPSLQKGDIIKAGDFDVSMIEVSGGNGTFSGTGQLVVPMMNHAKAGTEFTNIKVNDEYRMYEGSMNFTGVTVQALPDEVLDDINDFFDDVLALEDDIIGVLDVGIEIADSINSLVEEIQTTEVFTEEEYEKLVSEETTIEDLKEQAKEALADAVDAVQSGNIVEAAKQVAKAKKISQRAKAKQEQASQVDTVQVAAVEFIESGIGYDLGPGHAGIEPNYYKIITNQGDKYGPWISVEAGKSATLIAKWIQDSQIPKEEISFILDDEEINTTSTSEGWELTVPEGRHQDKRILKALHNGETVGIGAVVSYQEEPRKVTLVGINDATTPSDTEAADYLKRVFGPANVSWDVEVSSVAIDNSWDLNGNGNLYLDENNDLSTYTDESKALIQAVKSKLGQVDRDRYYILFTDIPNSMNADGFMPRKKQFGFVFDGTLHTLAHELGHGAFRLAHTWEEFPNLTEGETDNLMDYSAGEKLRQYQWDQIHDPKWVVSLFDDEEESLYAPWTGLDNGFLVYQIPETDDNSVLSFISPTGYIFSLPGRARDLTFDQKRGFLLAFTIDNERYLGLKKRSLNEFIGYRHDLVKNGDGTYSFEYNTSSAYSDELSHTLTNPEVYYVIDPSNECGQAILLRSEYVGEDANIEDVYGFSFDNPYLVESSVKATDFATSITTSIPITSNFDCLSSEAKFLYKFVQYKHDELDLNFIEDFSSRVDKYDIHFKGFSDVNETETTVYPLNLNEPNAIRLFNDWLKEKGSPANEAKLLIEILDPGGDPLFVDALNILAPFTETIQSLFNCFENGDPVDLEGYYVPLCFWLSSDVPITNYYNLAGGDPAFMSGFADGAIGTVVGLKDLVVGALKLKAAWTVDLIEDSETLEDVIRPYGLLIDKSNKIASNLTAGATATLISTTPGSTDQIDEIIKKAIIKELKAYQAIVTNATTSDESVTYTAELIRSMNEMLPEEIQVRKEAVLGALYISDPTSAPLSLINTPEEAAAVRQQTLDVLDFMVDFTDIEDATVRDQAIEAIKQEISTYLNTIDDTDNIARYKHGKVAFEVAVEVAAAVFTAGGGNVATGLKRFSKVLTESAETAQEFTRKFIRKMGLSKGGTKWFDDLPQGLKDDIGDLNSPLGQFIRDNPGAENAWRRLYKEGDEVSDILRRNSKILEWVSKQGDNIPQSALDDLLTQIDKPIKETIEDAQGRLTFVLDRPGQSNKVVSVHPTSNGQFKTTTYSPSYNPDLNPDIPVPLSNNRLTPDYSSTDYMHPDNKGLTVRIELSGNRSTDFTRSRDKLKELLDFDATDVIDETDYTWHHLDDFEIVGDKAYCTMQLVESSAHQGTGVLGMQHSGSVAQWRAYYGTGY